MYVGVSALSAVHGLKVGDERLAGGEGSAGTTTVGHVRRVLLRESRSLCAGSEYQSATLDECAGNEGWRGCSRVPAHAKRGSLLSSRKGL